MDCVPIHGKHENRCQEQKENEYDKYRLKSLFDCLILVFSIQTHNDVDIFSHQYSHRFPNFLASHPLTFFECKCNKPAKLLLQVLLNNLPPDTLTRKKNKTKRNHDGSRTMVPITHHIKVKQCFFSLTCLPLSVVRFLLLLHIFSLIYS